MASLGSEMMDIRVLVNPGSAPGRRPSKEAGESRQQQARLEQGSFRSILFARLSKNAQEQRNVDARAARKQQLHELELALRRTETEEDLENVMQPWIGKISPKLMVALLNVQDDWQRSLALHDWMLEKGGYQPSSFAYNVVLRNALRARQWQLSEGLVNEMVDRGLRPDKFTYSTLISGFSRAGKIDKAMAWFQRMEANGVKPDLVVYSTLIELSGKARDYSGAASMFSKLKASGIAPDRIVYNCMVNLLGKAKFYKEAERLLTEMEAAGIVPDTLSYSILINAQAESGKYQEAKRVFLEMKIKGVPLDVTACNMMISVYGHLQMVAEAESLFWSMREVLGLQPDVVTYNTMIKVFKEAQRFQDAFNLFNYMENNGVEPNAVTYNTMIGMLEHHGASRLVRRMQLRGIQPTAVTFSTLISTYGRAGKYEKAASLFNSLRGKGFKMDAILYQSMIAVYENAGLLAHANRLLEELKRPEIISRDMAISILAKADKLEEADRLYREFYQAGELRHAATFQAMVLLFVRSERTSKALEVLDDMRAAGYSPDSETAVALLAACAQLRRVETGEKLYLELREQGCLLSDEVHLEMLKLYGVTRRIREAEDMFEALLLEGRCCCNKEELYIAMVNIYKAMGRLSDAYRLLQEMQREAAS